MSELLSETKMLIDGLGLKELDKNSQNFLTDESIIESEIENAELVGTDVVLDIGTGFGYGINKIASICRIICVEKDVKIFSYLINKYELNGNVELINSDFLTLVPPAFTKVISNPPYSIVDRVLNKLLRYKFELGVMILPKTISDGLCGLSGSKRTKFSTVQRIFLDFNPIMQIPNTAFYPQPRVTSTMVKIKRKPNDFLQEVMKRDEMTVKNSILRAYQDLKNKTKRESKEILDPMEEALADIKNKEVKKLSLQELDQLTEYIRKNI